MVPDSDEMVFGMNVYYMRWKMCVECAETESSVVMLSPNNNNDIECKVFSRVCT
jgi:hypothetical protein